MCMILHWLSWPSIEECVIIEVERRDEEVQSDGDEGCVCGLKDGGRGIFN